MRVALQKPVVYIGERPSDFCVVTPLSLVAHYAEEAARAMGIRTCIALSGVDNDVEVALEMIRVENVKLLATRGYTEHILRSRTSVPILSIGYSAENFFETLLPFQNSGMAVGHLCFPGQGNKFDKIAQLLGIKGYRLEVEERDDLDGALAIARKRNIKLLIGGLGLISRAQKLGFRGIPLLAENREVVWQTFADARSMLAMYSISAGRNDFIRTILDTNPNIIIYCDAGRRITYANATAAETFAPLSLPGTPFPVLFPDADLGPLFSCSGEKPEPALLTDALGREFLLESTRIVLQDNLDGFIISLSNVADIQKNERKVRQKHMGRERRPHFTLSDITGQSPVICRARVLAARFARSEAPVLIVGETGTGKEMFAQGIHVLSARSQAPFISINCASLSEHLLESELFGYEEGAFTSARRGGKAGLFEVADRGTVFLDEIGEMAPAVQARLLRVLQDKVVTRLGGSRFVPVDVRIICATNRNLLEMVRKGTFRADLFYRINTLVLALPPLDAREGDTALIARAWLGSAGVSMTPEAMDVLARRHWRGNVRELLHVLERARTMCAKNCIGPADLVFDEDVLESGWARPPEPAGGEARELRELRAALERHQFNRTRTAAALGISRATLWKRMRRWGLIPPGDALSARPCP